VVDGIADRLFGPVERVVMFSFMRTGMAFMAVGIMEAAFEDALAYAQEREDVRRTDRPAPAGSGEALRRSDGDRDPRGLSRSAAEALVVDGDPDARLRLAREGVRLRTVDRPDQRRALQVLGASGLDLENRMERYYRDACVMTIPDGTTETRSSSSARS